MTGKPGIERRRRRWTRAEHALLERLVDEGQGYEAIARRLRRSVAGVILKAQARGTTIRSTGATLSAAQVGRLLGVSKFIVARWIRLAFLPATRTTRPDQQPHWRVTWEAVDAFLRDPDRSMLWAPERIADLELRAWAQEARAGHPRWLTVEQAAPLAGFAAETLRHRTARTPEIFLRRGWVWYVREDDVARLRGAA